MPSQEKDTLRALRLKMGQLQDQMDESNRDMVRARSEQLELQANLQSVEDQLSQPHSATAVSASFMQMRAAWYSRLESLILMGSAAVEQARVRVQTATAHNQALALEHMKYEKLVERLEATLMTRASRREQKQTDEMASTIFMRGRREASMAF